MPAKSPKRTKQTINHRELIKDSLRKNKLLGLNQAKAEEFFQFLIQEITANLKKDIAVKITSFGTFSTKTRYSRGGVNPQNPQERIEIPTVRVAKFKTGKKLKDSLK